MRKGKVLLVMVAVLAMAGAAGAQISIDYSGYASPGTNIEGVLLGNVTITSPSGDVTYVKAAFAPAGYGAPNGNSSVLNGCIAPEGGFTDIGTKDAKGKHKYVFNFFDDGGQPASVEDFQIVMYDFGDYNPYRKTYHKFEVRAYDNDGDLIASDVLEVISTTDINPPLLYKAGDACDALDGEPGNHMFSVAHGGIASVVLEEMTDSDPNIGFGAVEFTLEEPECDPVPHDLCAGQTHDIGEVIVTNDDTNLYVTFNITEAGWYLEETHVAVGDDPSDIPQTKKNNPIPGHFPYACDLEPMQTSCTVEIPLGDWCVDSEVVVAAHAAVVEVAGDGCETIFWANSIEAYDQGTLKSLDPVTADRVDPSAVFALGGAFYSLGLDMLDDELPDGWLTVGFGEPVYNGPGTDIVVQEVTNGRSGYPLERAEVFGVDDGTDYFAGTVTNKDNGDGFGSANLPAGKSTFDFVKLLDATDPAIHISNADGYDVDAIGACYLFLGDETAWGDGCGGTRFTDKGNWGTYFTYKINECAPQCEE